MASDGRGPTSRTDVDGVRVTRSRGPSMVLPGVLAVLAMLGWLVARTSRSDSPPPVPSPRDEAPSPRNEAPPAGAAPAPAASPPSAAGTVERGPADAASVHHFEREERMRQQRE